MICACGLVYDAGMKRTLPILIVASGAALLALGQAPAQTAAVPVTSEPHHHLVYSDENVRAFDVEVPAHSSTMLHEHSVDYIWVALGDSDVINAVAGKPEARLQVKDGTVRFTRGGFAHVARNESGSAFRNVTVELLKPQMNPHNLCDEVFPGGPVDCPDRKSDAEGQFRGSSVKLEFETSQMRASLLQLDPKRAMTIAASASPPVLIALERTEASAETVVRAAATSTAPAARPLHSGDVYRSAPGSVTRIRNSGKTTARFLALKFKAVKP
jgi:hypothetical protein